MSDDMDGASFVVDQPEGRFYAEVVYVNDADVSGGTLCGLAMSWEAERIAAAMNLCRGVPTEKLQQLIAQRTTLSELLAIVKRC